jgi:hypothetical protein
MNTELMKNLEFIPQSLPSVSAYLLFCRGPGAIERVIWIHSILTNKPNSPIVQMKLNNLTTMNYVIFTSLTKVKNKPNSNPIKAKTNPNKSNFLSEAKI